MSLRYYSNTASQAALASAIGATDTSITFTAGTFTGYPTQFPYTAALARGTANEEIVLVTAASGSTVTVTRAYDGTTAKAQGAGTTFTEVVVAKDYREANDHINATAGAHGVTGHVVGDTDTQTLTNKTLTNPTVTDGTFTGTQSITQANVTTLTVTGVTTLAGFSASGNGTVGGTLGVTGAATFSSTLAVTGASTLTGLLTANGGITVPTGKKVTLTDAPAATTDAANKAYVDGKTWPSSAISDASSAASGGKVVKWDGNGRIQAISPASSNDVATKDYVDTGDREVLAYIHGTATTNTPTDGSWGGPYIREVVTLASGRLYRVTITGRLSNTVAGSKTSWVIRAAAGGNGTVNTSTIVCSASPVHHAAGGGGQVDVTAIGYFTSSGGQYSFDTWISANSGSTGSLLADLRGRYDVVIEDMGANGGNWSTPINI